MFRSEISTARVQNASAVRVGGAAALDALADAGAAPGLFEALEPAGVLEPGAPERAPSDGSPPAGHPRRVPSQSAKANRAQRGLSITAKIRWTLPVV